MFEPGDDENTQQDANIEESSEPQQSTNSDTKETSAPDADGSQKQSESNVPFHEHPRFKELIEYKRQSEERQSQYERTVADLQRQYQESLRAREPKKELNPFVAKLKEIDPTYGEWAESVESRAAKADQIEAELREMRAERTRNQYESSMEKLHSENKVPDELKSRIKREIDYIAMTNPKLGLQDLPRVYKDVFADYSKFIDSVKRNERASYVADKSKDASAPTSQPRGKATSRNDKGQFTGDRETDLALIAKRALKISKAEGDL